MSVFHPTTLVLVALIHGVMHPDAGVLIVLGRPTPTVRISRVVPQVVYRYDVKVLLTVGFEDHR